MVLRILIVTAVAAEADSVAAGLTFGGPGSGEHPLPGGFVLRRHARTAPETAPPPPSGPHPGARPGTPAGSDAMPARGTDTGPADGAAPGSGSRSPSRTASGSQEPGHVLVDVLVGGVGPASVAVATATALAWASREHASPSAAGDPGPPTPPPATALPYDLVVSAGIGGGFQPGAPIGSVVVSDAIVAADLGAETPDGYLAVDALGFGRSVHRVPEQVTGRISAALAGGGQRHTVGPVLTVSTVTGSAERAAELARRHPGAVAEAMEGFGVAEAAAAYGVPVVEIRAVSNAVGPRDRGAWRIGRALDALRVAFQLLSHSVLVEPAP
ncbi:futalosine hydrolase [Streptomyces sp. NPDC053755]|uniref:futalosine hydrolase n=1 Tax=Streptomyces sp. NPDC053755 TaxID=3155815 RepID=UPI003434D954